MSELTKEQLLEYVKKQKLKMKKLETEIAALKEKAPTGVVASSAADGDVAALRSEVESLEQQLAAKDREISALSKAVEDSEDEKIKMVAHKNTEIGDLANQISALQAAASNASSQNAQMLELEATISDLRGKLEHAQSVSAAAEVVRMDLEGKFESVRNELDASRSSASALEAELASAKIALQAVQDNAEESGAAITEIRASLAASLEAERTLRDALTVESTSHANSRTELDAELARLRKELESAGTSHASLTTSVDGLRAELAQKTDQLTALAAENKDLQAKLTTASSAAAAVATARSATPPPEPVAAGGNGKKKGKNKKGKGKTSADAVEAAEAADAADETASVGAGPANVEVAALEAQLAESADRERALTEQIHRLQQDLSEACCRADEATGTIGSLREELAEMKTKAASAVEAAEATAATTAALQAAWLSEKASLDVQVQNLTNEVHSAQERLQGGESQANSELAALRQQLESSAAALSAAEECKSRAEKQIEDQRGELAAVVAERESGQQIIVAQKDSIAHASDLVGKLQAAAETMRNEISSLRAASIAAASGTDSAVEALQAEVAQKTAALQSADESRVALETEIGALKEAAAQADVMTKRLTLKLKQKMKECTDVAAELAAQKELVGKLSSSEESSKTALSEQLQAALAGRASDKSEFEAKLKSSNDALIAGEERISGILREKNKLQEDLFASLHKVESATKESHAFKAERDQARQQYLDVETKLQTLSASTREKIDALTAKVAELTAANTKLTAQVSTATEALALSNSEITTLKENATALAQAKEKLKAQNAAVETLKQQLAETKADAEAKAEAANERNKKLKQLLAKVNAMAQEKESKLVQFQSMTDRAKKFNIVTRIGVVPPQDPAGQVLEWCLIYEHRAAPAAPGKAGAAEESKDTEALPQYRWIEQRVAHKWVAEGSTLVGAWPHPVQETWAAEMAVLRTRLEAERDEITAKYEETSSQFQAYKVRAQTALKRIGNEDRNEKLKAQEAENAEIEKLRTVIQELKEKEAEFALAAGAKDRSIGALEKTIEELRAQVDVLENTIADGEQTQKANERKISMLQKEIETLQEDSRVMKEQYEVADRTNREKRLQQMRVEEEAALRLVKKANSDAAAAAAARATSPPLEASATAETTEPASSPTMGDSAAPQRTISRAPSQTVTTPSPRGRPLAVEAALSSDLQQDGPDSKLLLFQQADSVLKDSILVLRQENALLMVEINELKNDLGLREDQVTALKNTIRELESSLCREKEFNAENRRINADYLVNILRNFLMSTEPSERAKLVPVLCQILHLRPEESKIIAEKWAVRGGGLVGWLLPQRPAPAAPSAPVRYQAHATGMSIDRGDPNNGKSSAGDLTYDPSTGAGIDVNGY